MYRDRCVPIEQPVLPVTASCEHALLCGPFDINTFLCLMLIHVTDCSGTREVSAQGKDKERTS